MLIQNISSTASGPAWTAGNGGAAGAVAHAPRTVAAQPAAQQATPQPAGQLSQERLSDGVSKINSALQRNSKNLELNIGTDEATEKQVVRLTDKETGEVVIQYPSDAVLAIAQSIDEFQQGLLLKQKA